MGLFQDVERFSDNLASLIRRVFERDYSGVSETSHARSFDDQSEGHKIVDLGKHIFGYDTLEFQFIPEAREGPIVTLRNRTAFRGEPNPTIEGEIRLETGYAPKRHCSGFEITFFYKMPNGTSPMKREDLPESYERDNALDLGHFIEVSGRLPTSVNVQFPGYSSSVYFRKFEGDVNNQEEVRAYVVDQVVQGIETNRKGELRQINDYYGDIESREKETALKELDERTEQLKASVSDPSTEFYFTGVSYANGGFDFTRAPTNKFRREGFHGDWVANTLKFRLREVTDEAIEVLPHLLKSYLVPQLKE